MLRVYSCLTTQHDWRLVLLAGAICFLTSLAAVNLFRRACATGSWTRVLWLVTAGAATGYGIWATHFIAMLAYDAGMPVGYDLTLTVVSLLAAVLMSGTALAVSAENKAIWAAPVGGTIFGLGVAVMHYTGMSALEISGQVAWSLDLVLVSIGVGVLFGIAALYTAMRGGGIQVTLASALFLTLAIVGHHFTAMGAITIIPDPTISITALSLSPLALGMTIASAAVAVLGISLVAALAGSSRQQLIASSDAEIGKQVDRLEAALTNMSQGLAMFDRDRKMVICNDRYVRMYNLSPEQVKPGTPLAEIVETRIADGVFAFKDPEQYRIERQAPTNTATDHIYELNNGRVIAVSCRPMPDGGWVATHEDITERRLVEARLAYQANHDVLTDLPNRALLRERLEQAATAMREGGRRMALLMLDLDRFKEVNETLGYPIGDALLKIVTERLRGCVRETDTIARLGGDEFAIVQRVADPAIESVALAKRIQEVITAPFDLNGHHVLIGTSIGIAVAPGDGADPDQLMKNADLALYRAKNEGRGTYRFFEQGMDQRMQARRSLERDLRNALVNGEFCIHYQPLINIERDEICCFEALLRWTHPERGKVAPADFIPLAEETGLIVPIGEWVLRQACSEAATWPDHLRIAVNVSVAQFKSRNLVELVVNTLAATGMEPQRLELEITESVMLEDEEGALTILTRLHDLGVRIALDDFGTGYSSLSNLRKFPFDKIKIDRSFVSDLSATNLDALAVVRSIAQLGVSLGMSTTAEGVETEEQMDQVRSEGCTEMQGFLFSRAVPADEITRLFLTDAHKLATAAQ